MTASTQQLFAISALVGECESLTGSGDLNESQERSLRMLIAHVLSAFHMPSKHERANSLPQEFTDDRFETMVASERNMAATVEPLLRLLVNNEVKP